MREMLITAVAERLAIEVSVPGRDLSCVPVCRASRNTRTIQGF